jgi:exopolysaccharide biosynthesis polyprenyl glycosylphosphotransferase
MATSRQHSQLDPSFTLTRQYFDGDYSAEYSDPLDFEVSAGKNFILQRWRYLYSGLLIILDFLSMVLVCLVIFGIKPVTYASIPFDGLFIQPLSLVVVLGLIWVFSLAVCGTYWRHVMAEGYDLYAKIMNAVLLDFALICAVGFLLHLAIPRTIMVAGPVLAGCLTLVERWLMRRFLHFCRRRGRMVYPTVIVGSVEGIEETIALLEENVSLGYSPVAVCPIRLGEDNVPESVQDFVGQKRFKYEKNKKTLRVLGFDSHLPQTARSMNAQVILVVDTLPRQSSMLNAFSLAVEASGMELSLGVETADIGGHLLRLHNTASSLPVLTAQLPQYTFLMRCAKRLLDIILSSIALIISAIPIMIVAILIKREDGGPVFFTQNRVGLFGKQFKMYKIRSMSVGADKDEVKLAHQRVGDNPTLFKMENDPRITKIGKFIRKTSIDEIPQFFNVIKGDMSLVGPRPALPYQVENYNFMYSTRLLVKPGLTGPWQISGRSDLDLEQSERLDVNYVESWSLTADMAILLKTVIAVIRGVGSY